MARRSLPAAVLVAMFLCASSNAAVDPTAKVQDDRTQGGANSQVSCGGMECWNTGPAANGAQGTEQVSDDGSNLWTSPDHQTTISTDIDGVQKCVGPGCGANATVNAAPLTPVDKQPLAPLPATTPKSRTATGTFSPRSTGQVLTVPAGGTINNGPVWMADSNPPGQQQVVSTPVNLPGLPQKIAESVKPIRPVAAPMFTSPGTAGNGGESTYQSVSRMTDLLNGKGIFDADSVGRDVDGLSLNSSVVVAQPKATAEDDVVEARRTYHEGNPARPMRVSDIRNPQVHAVEPAPGEVLAQ